MEPLETLEVTAQFGLPFFCLQLCWAVVTVEMRKLETISCHRSTSLPSHVPIQTLQLALPCILPGRLAGASRVPHTTTRHGWELMGWAIASGVEVPYGVGQRQETLLDG